MASFERVMFGLRQFDLVFVLKDYSKNVVAINSIPVEALETLQEWLTKVKRKREEIGFDV